MTASGPESAPPIVHEVLRSSGQPLDAKTQSSMGPRFGHDFSHVRVHTDGRAAESARAVNALAYTVGHDMVFGAGQYTPGTRDGQRLLTHELTHVVQQRYLHDARPQHGISVAAGDHTLEQEARATTLATDRAGRAGERIEGITQAPLLLRVGLGENLARLFGGGTFSEQELQAYLQFLDQNDRIEDNFDSDNKARAIVQHWKSGDSLYILPERRKTLLIQEMLSGFTGDADELAILDLLRGSTDTELSTILTAVGRQTLESNFHGDERKLLDQLLAARLAMGSTARQGQAGANTASSETFSGETVLEVQKRFTSNAESTNRLNCILIVRELAPQLFAQDPQLAQRVQGRLGQLGGGQLKMTEVGRALSDLGLASAYREIRFNNGNGTREPTAMQGSAWDSIIGMVGQVQGWHIFGMAVFDGYHSVTVFVDNRADGPRVYWADQWRIDPGDDFHQEPGSVSGFRRYGKAGFDAFINEKTKEWWDEVFNKKGKKYKASLHIWKFRSNLPASGSP